MFGEMEKDANAMNEGVVLVLLEPDSETCPVQFHHYRNLCEILSVT